MFLLLTLTACGDPYDYDYTLVDYGDNSGYTSYEGRRQLQPGGDTLVCELPWVIRCVTSEEELPGYASPAHLQRFRDGQWWDIGQDFTVYGSWMQVELDLSPGYYRMLFPFQDRRLYAPSDHDYGTYEFAVGSLSDLTSRDLPAGRETVEAMDVQFEWIDEVLYTNSLAVSYQETYGPDTNYHPQRIVYYEVKLEGQWCQLPSVYLPRTVYSDTSLERFWAYKEMANSSVTFRYPYTTDHQVDHTKYSVMLHLFDLVPGEYRLVGVTEDEAHYIALPSFTVVEGQWDTSGEHPTLVLEAADSKRYAVAVHSNNLTVEERMERADTIHVWLPGEEKPTSVSCIGERPERWSSTPLWTQSGDEALTDGVLRLQVKHYSAHTELRPDGTWRLQELVDGRWYDREERGSGLSYDSHAVWGTVALDLPAGTYRLMLPVNETEGAFVEMPFYFSVP